MDDIVDFFLPAVCVVLVLAGLAFIGWVFDVIRKAIGGGQDQDYKHFYEDKDRARAQFQAILRERALVLLDTLQIENRATSPLLHEPIYDCAADQFELPCEDDKFRDALPMDPMHGGGSLGWFNDRWAVTRLLENLLAIGPILDFEHMAVVGNSCYLAILSEMAAGKPGATVWQLVRTGENEWYCHAWKAGFRPSAAEVDAPFYVRDLIRDPDRWDQWERTMRAARQANQNYQAALRRCRHRHAG